METKINPEFADYKIIFYFCDCYLDKSYSFWNLGKENAKNLIRRLKYFEKMDWRTLSGLSREKGLASEIPNTRSFEMIHNQNSCEDKIVEQYYFHLRIINKFRVFGYQKEQLFCITHINPNGNIHHK